MDSPSWPSAEELNRVRTITSVMSGRDASQVKIAVSPYRICPLGAHIDHQGGNVLAMTINKGILLGFVPSNDTQVFLRSGQFEGDVKFSIDDVQQPRSMELNHPADRADVEEEANWGNYARGAIYALQTRGKRITQGITGFISGSKGVDSSGLSSSAAVGIAYLLAFEHANMLPVSPLENIELDRIIENEYLGLRNGILDQSAILLSNYGFLTSMNCKTWDYRLISSPRTEETYKILLVFSGLKHALTSNSGYNDRVAECRDAAAILLRMKNFGCSVTVFCSSETEPLEMEMCSPCSATRFSSCCLAQAVGREVYEAHKGILESNLAKRAEHFFSESARVDEGVEAWASGDLLGFGNLMTASALSSIHNYECGSKPLRDLLEILTRAPGVYGGRFSGAGFRGCCVAIADARRADEAASFVEREYRRIQPELAGLIDPGSAVLVCETGESAHLI